MEKIRQKLLLIDGHSIINRAFYGIPDLTCSEGLHTNAIYGFLNIFFNVYSKIIPDYLIVAFDRREKTFRHEMYKEYKGNRKPMPAELNEQVPVLKEVLHSMNIKTAELLGFEADDIIGTYAKNANDDGLDVVILSGDRDLLQLATDSTMIMIPKTRSQGSEIETYFASDVLRRFQVTPSEFVDLKALMGDSSDNIPGVKGIGEKSATEIIVKFKSIENAYAHLDEITPKRASLNLKNDYSSAVMSKKLALIDCFCPVEFSYTDAHVSGEDIFYNSSSYKLFKRLELNRLLNRFDVNSINEDSSEKFDYKPSDKKGIIDSIRAAEKIGLYISDDLNCIAISLIQQNKPRSLIYINEKSDDDAKELIFNIFEISKHICIFGLKDALHAIKAVNFYSDKIYDISILAYLANPILSSYTFDTVSKDWLNKIIPSENDLIGKNKENTSSENKIKVAALSAECALMAEGPLLEEINRRGMLSLLKEIELPLIYSLYNMERAGVKADPLALREFSSFLSEKMVSLEANIFKEAGENFNINSPKQLAHILFEKLMLPCTKKTKTGYSTSADVLEKLSLDYPIVKNILEYRQASKLRSTYAEGLSEFISADGRIHGKFNQTVTATGRISSSDPNLQNIPIRTELGQEIRKAFVPERGYVFIDADYSQIELRILAHMSGDENLIAAYGADSDIHKITAAKVFNVPLNEVTALQRRSAKAVNFGIVYGITSFGLSKDLSISKKQAEIYIKQYFETYPQVKKYLDKTVSDAKRCGYTKSLYGRIRPIPELSSGNFMQRSFGERAAMNSPIQGSAADIMKIAMIRVEKALKEANLSARIVLQVHDELLIEAPEAEREKAKEILLNEMKNAAHLKVNLEVDVNEGRDWFSAH